ncbi:MAG: sugar phosphate isomerase/epimerase [Pirellulaceae bacterium]|nr:sugar phosphate isomerase/epimerase [Pirellulaceae bacterium]
MKRRRFMNLSMASIAAANLPRVAAEEDPETLWSPRYMLSSCMYGYQKLETILPEVAKTGATAIDIWPKVHGDQREQLDALGEEAFAALLDRHEVSLGCITQYKLGPFGLKDEMRLAERLGCKTIVTGAKGPADQRGVDLKRAVGQFADTMQPHLEIAAETDVTIAIENHGNSLIQSPDSVKWLIDLCDNDQLGIALAPYHLPQDPALLSKLIRDCGPRLTVFYAWQHGMGCMEKLPKEQELLQMPGRGILDFGPIVDALASNNYQGWTSIFMHPVPRGIPILETTEQVTDEINRARTYLQSVAKAPVATD